MKTIGLIGGMSWESTLTYYQIINEAVKRELGGLHSAKLLLASVDFAQIEACQQRGDWAQSARILTDAAQSLEAAGAEFLLICTNTMHKVVPQIQAAIHIPILHIADAAAQALREQGITTAALLGTKYTMTQDFYKERLEAAGLQVLTPEGQDVETVNDVIFQEPVSGNPLSGVQREVLLHHRQTGGKGRPGGDSGLHGDRTADWAKGHAPAGF